MRRLGFNTSLCLALLAGAGCDGSGSDGGAPPPSSNTIHFSTYLGSDAHDFVRDVAVDAQGNVYAVGGSRSSDLPTTMGTAQPVFGGLEDAFAVKFDPQGAILWSTYLGGASLDRAYAVELDGQGNVVLAGRAGANFPVTPGAVQTQFQGGTPGGGFPAQDGFVAKLDGARGTLLWATYFGASIDQHIIRDIAVDGPTGFIYLAASSDTGAFTAAVATAFQAGHQSGRLGGNDGVLARLSGNGAQLSWATFVGGSDEEDGTASVRVDAQGNAVILFSTLSTNAETTPGAWDRTPNGLLDFYVAKFALNGALVWASYVGGSDQEATETHNLALRGDGSVVIAARSRSIDFPVQAGAFDVTHNGNGGPGTGAGTNYASDCVVAILSAGGDALPAGTFYGGRFGEGCEGVGADGNGNVYATGSSFSDDLPVTSGAFQAVRPGTQSAFVVVFNRDLTRLRFGSFFGGTGSAIGRDLAVHAEGHFVFGAEAGAGYPLRNAARSAVSASELHGAVSDLAVTLGPG